MYYHSSSYFFWSFMLAILLNFQLADDNKRTCNGYWKFKNTASMKSPKTKMKRNDNTYQIP